MLSIPTRKTVRLLWVATITINLLGLLRAIFKYALDFEYGYELLDIFDLNEEKNIPAWYSASILLLCGVILYFISLNKQQSRDKYCRHWLWLGFIFFYLSMDEAISIHEDIKLHFFGKEHIFYDDSWVLVYGILVAIFVFSYRRFLRHLPVATRRMFIVSGCIYVSGTIGMEVVGSFTQEFYGKGSIVHAMATTIEECLEMVGIVVFFNTLLSYASIPDSLVSKGE
ncbi:MAG: hypothetical protein ACFB9N_17515 [Geitlerinemataceae cyanobacterium]